MGSGIQIPVTISVIKYNHLLKSFSVAVLFGVLFFVDIVDNRLESIPVRIQRLNQELISTDK